MITDDRCSSRYLILQSVSDQVAPRTSAFPNSRRSHGKINLEITAYNRPVSANKS